MEYKTKKRDDATAQITVKNSPEEVEQSFKNAYVKAQKKLKLPGFRAGKVPLPMVEQHLGDSVAEDAVRGLIADTLQDIIEELDPTPISMPQFEVESFDKEKGAVFSGTYDTHPEVKLGKYKKLKATEDYCKVGDEAVDEQLEQMRKDNAILNPREEGTIADNDVLTLNLNVLEGENSIYKADDLQFQVGAENALPGMNENLVGLPLGENKSYTQDFPADFPNDHFAGKNLTVDMQVQDVKSPEYPELNDDFAKDMGEHETLVELKDKLRSDFQEKATDVLQKRVKDSLLNDAVSDAKFTVPNSMIEQGLKRRVEMIGQRMGQKELDLDSLSGMLGKKPEELAEELKESALKNIHEELVLVEVSKKEELEITDDDVAEEIKKRFGSMMPPEQLASWMEQDGIKQNIRDSMVFTRTMDFIFENAEIKKGKDISFEELKKADDYTHQQQQQ